MALERIVIGREDDKDRRQAIDRSDRLERVRHDRLAGDGDVLLRQLGARACTPSRAHHERVNRGAC